MDIKSIINTKEEIKPSVYAYIIPDYPKRLGWVKIGYTDREVEKRIAEQSHTVGVETQTLWNHIARFNSGEYFKDHQFHSYLAKHSIPREKGKEWFDFGVGKERDSEDLFIKFTFQKYDEIQKDLELSYTLRKEQQEAVNITLDYAKSNPNGEFLWNAKPRFGKTLSAYDFARKLNAKNVLVVTNRPAIANSWYDDFKKFIAWQTKYVFVSESTSITSDEPLSRLEYNAHYNNNPESGQIAFLSLQDLKGSQYFGGTHDKLYWVAQERWDLLIIDEAHEGVDTFKTDVAFDNIERKFTLHLSGTPFKAIASGKFDNNQIYNWSYAEEQEAKQNWNDTNEEENPYRTLPQLNMLTYQMSQAITDEVNKGANLDGEEVDYAFDLNEFFATKDNGTFIYEEAVSKWLYTLTSNEKYPFSTDALRNELKHTFWILERVDSAKALARLLKTHPVFEDYEIVLAAGDGIIEDSTYNISSLLRVKNAIKDHDKTITISVGQLTTGVTIPEWTAVLMLSNMKSAAQYMQAAFRAQNPYEWEETIDGKSIVYQKQNAYVFDFAPERTLVIFDQFANNLNTSTTTGGGTTEDRKENIRRLLNFFPIIGEDQNGVMKELDVNDVLTIPRTLKAAEVVRRGFMSNLLFANISGIFSAPQVALNILEQLNPETQGKVKDTNRKIDLKGIKVDDEGSATVSDELVINKSGAIFGDKIYEVESIISELGVENGQSISVDAVAKQISSAITSSFSDTISSVKSEYGLTNAGTKKVENKITFEVEETVKKATTDFNIQKAHIEKDFNVKIETAQSDVEVEQIRDEWKSSLQEAANVLQKQLEKDLTETIETVKVEVIKEQEIKKENQKKTSVEEDVRSRLRGFSRTIPSFIMAYGDENLTLKEFDSYVPNDVFEEVTGITINQFIFLRDGGDYEENGEIHHFNGNLFDETVFNQSILEFLKKKNELANYFEDLDEDIFDYIPPQKTNQIFTPKNVVEKMVQTLEDENPNIFDDSRKTFIDLYMKSGLYITEIVKRLYNSDVLKKEFPNDEYRIKHILENQVYGFAPSEIIYRIAINFIFGNLDESVSRKNFVQVDTIPYAKEGTIDELITKTFEEETRN